MTTPDIAKMLKRYKREARDVEEVEPFGDGHWVIKFTDGGELEFHGTIEKVLSVFEEKSK